MNKTHQSGTIIVGFDEGIEFTNMGGTMHWNITPLNYTGDLPLPATNHVLRLRKGERFAAHFHENSWDQINIIQGTCHFFLNGEEVIVGPGHSVMVPPRVTHEMYNPYDEDVVSVDIQIPPDPHIYERATQPAGAGAKAAEPA